MIAFPEMVAPLYLEQRVPRLRICKPHRKQKFSKRTRKPYVWSLPDKVCIPHVIELSPTYASVAHLKGELEMLHEFRIPLACHCYMLS